MHNPPPPMQRDRRDDIDVTRRQLFTAFLHHQSSDCKRHGIGRRFFHTQNEIAKLTLVVPQGDGAIEPHLATAAPITTDVLRWPRIPITFNRSLRERNWRTAKFANWIREELHLFQAKFTKRTI